MTTFDLALAAVLAAVTGGALLLARAWLPADETAQRSRRLLLRVAVAAVALPFVVVALRAELDAPAATRGRGFDVTAALTSRGGDAAALEAEAQAARRERDFTRATRAFAELAARGSMTADLWADYADALGAAHGSLQRSEAQIQHALTLQPRHPKALWLLGSLQTERQDYRAALATWDLLLTVLPADSPDARIVADNRREAAARTGAAGAAGGTPWAWPLGGPSG